MYIYFLFSGLSSLKGLKGSNNSTLSTAECPKKIQRRWIAHSNIEKLINMQPNNWSLILRQIKAKSNWLDEKIIALASGT